MAGLIREELPSKNVDLGLCHQFEIRIVITILFQEAAPVESSVITKVREDLKTSFFSVCLVFSFFFFCLSVGLTVPQPVCLFVRLKHFVCAMQVKGTTTSVKEGSDGFENLSF